MNLKMLYQEQLYAWGQLEFGPRSDAKQVSDGEFEKVKQAATESRVTTRKANDCPSEGMWCMPEKSGRIEKRFAR
jgi:hypothetical protein